MTEDSSFQKAFWGGVELLRGDWFPNSMQLRRPRHISSSEQPTLANRIDKTHVLSQLRCQIGISLEGPGSRESTPEGPGFGRQCAVAM